jgi:hypothetical protein
VFDSLDTIHILLRIEFFGAKSAIPWRRKQQKMLVAVFTRQP